MPWTEGALDDTKETFVFLHSLGGGSSSYEWSKVYPAIAESIVLVVFYDFIFTSYPCALTS
jgi:hypothetical protein